MTSRKLTFRSDAARALLLLAVALIAAIVAWQFPPGGKLSFGPAWLPLIAASVLAIAGIILVISTLLQRDEKMPQFIFRPLTAITLAMVLFAVALEPLGLAVAVALSAAITRLARTEGTILGALTFAAAASFISVALFVWLLGLPLRVLPWS